jgi:flagellar biosynthesis/type III secretory pathway chaperone
MMSSETQLLELLKKIIKLQKSLHQLAIKKTEMLKSNDIDGLGQLIKDELSHIKALEALHKTREQLQVAIGREYDCPFKINTMSDLLRVNGIVHKESFKEFKNELVHITEQLKAINILNQELLNQSLQFVNLNLDLFFGQQDSGNYSPLQSEEEEAARPIFNSKA